jgi:hypothetical protein
MDDGIPEQHEGILRADGYAAAVALLRSYSIDLLGTLEVINQQAPLYADRHDPGDPNREQLTKMITDLANKTSRLGTAADKIMSIIFVGDPNEAATTICTQREQSSTDDRHPGSGDPVKARSDSSMGDPGDRHVDPRDTLPRDSNGEDK